MDIPFAHENLRPNQKEFMTTVTAALEGKTHALIHAPTGTGKTAAVLAATIAYAKKNHQIVFFITPRHTQHAIALETIRAMEERNNIKITTANIVGKKYFCAHAGTEPFTSGEFNEYCKNQIKDNACSFYKNIRQKNKLTIQAQLALNHCKQNITSAEQLKTIATKNVVCPYEIALLHAQTATCIIADYNHIINPSIRDILLKKLEKSLKNCIIIVDEAHNAPMKAREILSEKLTDFIIKHAAREAKKIGYVEIGEDILRLKNILEMLEKKIAIEKTEEKVSKEDFTKALHEEFKDLDEFTGNCIFVADAAKEIKQKGYLKSIVDFLSAWPGPDHGFVRYIRKGINKAKKPTISLHYDCLDPALLFGPLANNAHSIIAMSGTLTPLDMYKDVLGFPASITELHNPFPKENKLTLIVPDTTTKYTARSSDMFQKIANYCIKIIKEIPGNVIFFFPSYQLRDNIQPLIEKECKKTSFKETQNLSKKEKQEMLEKFKSYKKIGAVLFAASAGNFGEGIDLKGDFLQAVVVVGIPLGKPDVQTIELINYYDHKYGKGWEYGYTMPAIIKTMQNAGRCIRSETDRGVVVLLDQRYQWKNYLHCCNTSDNLQITLQPETFIKEFFGKIPEQNHNSEQQQQTLQESVDHKDNAQD